MLINNSWLGFRTPWRILAVTVLVACESKNVGGQARPERPLDSAANWAQIGDSRSLSASCVSSVGRAIHSG